jgi:hypothetical protein
VEVARDVHLRINYLGELNSSGAKIETYDDYPAITDIVSSGEDRPNFSIEPDLMKEIFQYLYSDDESIQIRVTVRYRTFSFSDDSTESPWRESTTESKMARDPNNQKMFIIHGYPNRRVGKQVDGPLWPLE